jgi:hypothetical protein
MDDRRLGPSASSQPVGRHTSRSRAGTDRIGPIVAAAEARINFRDGVHKQALCHLGVVLPEAVSIPPPARSRGRSMKRMLLVSNVFNTSVGDKRSSFGIPKTKGGSKNGFAHQIELCVCNILRRKKYTLYALHLPNIVSK